MMTPALDEGSAWRYGEYVAALPGANVIWLNGGDRIVRDAHLKAVWRALASGVKAGDTRGGHVMTFTRQELRLEPESGTSATWFHHDAWLDFNMLQTGLRFLEEDQCARYLAEYRREPAKPYVDGETRYENSNRGSAQAYPAGPKIGAYQVQAVGGFAVSGALGHSYGCRDVWSFHVPSDRTCHAKRRYALATCAALQRCGAAALLAGPLRGVPLRSPGARSADQRRIPQGRWAAGAMTMRW